MATRLRLLPANGAIASAPPVVAASEPMPARSRANDISLLARWLDNAFRVPGLGVRFGWDAILGLIPGLGDAATSVVSLYILRRAQQLGASRATLARMGLNVALDAVVGTLPLVGDLFDLYWKANLRNAALLERHVAASPGEIRSLRKRDRAFVTGLIAGIAALLVTSLVAAFWLATWLATAIQQALT
jgi:hypothetical protein